MPIDLPDIDYFITGSPHVLKDHGTVPNCAQFMDEMLRQANIPVDAWLQDMIEVYLRSGVSMGGYHFIIGNEQHIIIQEDIDIVMHAERARQQTSVALDIVGTPVLDYLTSAMHMPDLTGIISPDEMREYGAVYGLLRRGYSVPDMRALAEHYEQQQHQINFIDATFEHPFPSILEQVLMNREMLQ